MTIAGRPREIPVLYVRTEDELPVVFPLSRQFLGEKWAEEAEVASLTFSPTIGDELSFLATRLDVPLEMASLLLTTMSNECGPYATQEEVAEWARELLSPVSKFLAMLPCKRCGCIRECRWNDVAHLRAIEAGIVCAQVGRRCEEDDAPATDVGRRSLPLSRSPEGGRVGLTPRGPPAT